MAKKGGKKGTSGMPGDLVRRPRPAPNAGTAKRDAGGGSRDAVVKPMNASPNVARGPEVGLPSSGKGFGKGEQST